MPYESRKAGLKGPSLEKHEKVLEILKRTGGWLGTSAIAARVGWRHTYAPKMLRQMEAEGLIEWRPSSEYRMEREWRAIPTAPPKTQS
jgi:DNA-binding IclR family transcriptional regulator